ncbi:MAG: hypothetical protein EPN39_02425 [Chitinophagaceae bacterium]|nr:MAG: hypothetical protein EPN39_02425 [Chitinophagaceae bacterium]
MNNFHAGAAQIDITPPLGTLINGDFVSHYAHLIHDPLYAKAIVLRNDQVSIAFVVVDICLMQKDFIEEVKNQINKQTNINPGQILISATHTHGGGSVEGLLLAAADLPYRQKLKQRIVSVVMQAKERLRPAKIAFGSVEVPEHVVCRRYFMQEGYEAYNPVTGKLDKIKTNPFGGEDRIVKRENVTDPEVSYLALQGQDNQWIGLLANYSMHYVGDWENGTITSDYFGVFAKQLKSLLRVSDNFVAIMSNGTSGDANIVDLLQPDRYPKGYFTKSAFIGKDIAERTFNSLRGLTWDDNPTLSSLYEEIPVKVRKPSSIELKAAERVVMETRYDHLSMKEVSHTGNDDNLKRIYAREQVLLSEYPDAVLFPLQVIKVGIGMIGGLGGEFFAKTGLWLKENGKTKNYFTVCLANGYTGYVPPAHEFDLGGYETWRCRSSFLEINAEKIIRDKLHQLINLVKK